MMRIEKPTPDFIRDVVKKAGGAIKVASSAEICRTSVYKWIYKGQVPAEHVQLLACMSGVDAVLIRPDVFLRQQKTPQA